MKIINIALISITALTVLLASSIFTFAASDTIADTSSVRGGQVPQNCLDLTDKQRDAIHQARLDSVDKALDNLVADGVLLQEDADKFQERQAFIPRERNREKIELTAEEREAIRQERLALSENVTAIRNEMKPIFEDAVADLVENGTITQEQAGQILDFNDLKGPHMMQKNGPRQGNGKGQGFGNGTGFSKGQGFGNGTGLCLTQRQ